MDISHDLSVTGLLVYCPRCYRQLGIYRPEKDAPPIPMASRHVCRDCKRRETTDTSPPPRGPSTSVWAIPCGLPGLGKRRR